MFQKIVGIICLIISLLLINADVRNPEFLWVVGITGIAFILMPNIFTKEDR